MIRPATAAAQRALWFHQLSKSAIALGAPTTKHGTVRAFTHPPQGPNANATTPLRGESAHTGTWNGPVAHGECGPYDQFQRPRYTLALCRDLPDSFTDALTMRRSNNDANSDPPNSISMSLARHQHEQYVQTIRRFVPVLVLPAVPSFPDCCFVEDTVVVIGNRALILRMGHSSRRGEVGCIKDVMLQLGMDVHDMRDMSETACCDGGDVLFTGRHLFIGLSDRTNQEGAQLVAATFGLVESVIVPPISTIDTVGLANGWLHLKSAVTHMNPVALIAPHGPVGDRICDFIHRNARGYTVYRVRDPLACNVISCHGTLMAQDTACLESRRVLETAATEQGLDLVYVDTSELAKKDAALTCGTVLLGV